MTRIAATFAALKEKDRAAFIPFIMAGDPDYETSLALLKALPGAGADLIELGVAFTDPMADGPAIQAAGLRALKSGQTLAKTLAMASEFRRGDDRTPLILMGYYNPFYAYGVDRFVRDAKRAGVDGLIVVDLPPEEDAELYIPARAGGLDFIRLATPTTDAKRLPVIVRDASGFLYYVSVAGITGTRSGEGATVAEAVSRLRTASALPVVVGFGVKTAEKAASIARIADGVVVGSALVGRTGPVFGAPALEPRRAGGDSNLRAVIDFVRELSLAIRGARTGRTGGGR